MSRVSRIATVGAVLVGLLSVIPVGSPLLSVNAAPGLGLLDRRAVGAWTRLPPGQSGTSLLERLLRRPGTALGGGIPSVKSPFALQFDGKDDRVQLGLASALGATDFTIEVWFMRQGPGIATNTGGGGVTAVPLVTKGMAEGDGTNKDANYFLGIDTKTGALAADFEEWGPPPVPPALIAPLPAGANHPIVGTTRISDGVWYHAAATYDSTTGAFRLYLNGAPEASLNLTPGIRPRFDSIQHAALGAAFTSTGVYAAAGGAFQGQMDEVRIWNVARSQAAIDQAKSDVLLPPQAGLIGRWALDEGTGTAAGDTAGATHGTLFPAAAGPVGPAVWIDGSSFLSTPRAPGDFGLKLTGLLPGTTSAIAGDYVALGPAPALGAKKFTLEAWIMRTGGGTATATGASTSSGTLTAAIPLITKGMAEGDGGPVDANYFFGINQVDGKLAADFEDTATGANHRAFGLTTIAPNSTWHHVAVTFDGTNWQFYLDGMPDGTTSAAGFVPRFDSIQHAAIGSALNSTGGITTGQTQGFFAGVMDEVRIWNYARSGSQIFSGKSREISTASGLLGRWSFNDGYQVIDSTGHVPNGTLMGSGWTFVNGSTSLPGTPNTAPTVNAGSDQAIAISSAAVLAPTVTDDGVAVPLTYAWTQTGGSGTATLLNASAQNTSATFSAAGTYELTLTVSDGELSTSDALAVTVTAPVNVAPIVDAGSDHEITLPTNVVTLSGTVSDDGLPGPALTSHWTKISGPGPVTFTAPASATTDARFAIEGTYVLQLDATDTLLSVADTVTVIVNPNPVNKGIKLGGTDAFVTFGQAPQLGASTFTLESWIRRDGAGTATFTGTGGITAVPLITKGMAEVDDSNNKDMNYFLGIRGTDGVLVADFEDSVNGTNHPVVSTTVIPTDSSWHHVAATYDGTTWRLYVDGVEKATLVVGPLSPRADSIQHAALGTALNSSGIVTPLQPTGRFSGAMDEVRIWNYARSAAQILNGRNRGIAAATGLIGRWGLNENAGSTAGDSSSSSVSGAITGTDWSWVSGGPFTGAPNAAPVVDAGADQSVTMPAAVTVAGSVTDDGVTGASTTTSWTKKSGPGVVAFTTPAASSTGVDFSMTGTYVLTLTASDGELSSSDDMTIVVGGVINQPPAVDAGADHNITLPVHVVSLSGSAADDGVPSGPVTTQWTKVSGPGTVTFGDTAAAATSATFAQQGTYVLRLAASDGVFSVNDTTTVVVNPNPANKAVQFGANAYVTFGASPSLGASKFTLETWFRRDAAGVGTFTGTGGVTAVPLITKGMAEIDANNNKDMNYFLGIDAATNKLVADFEDMATGGNHPVSGTTVIPADGQWRHAAVTYDGTTWRLYLNGAIEGNANGVLVGNVTPRSDSIQHAALGTALNSAGVVTALQTQGSFSGALDEARIWNYARSGQQISRGRLLEIPIATPGLLARWGMNEGSGTAVGDSTAHLATGTITGSNFSWVAGAPFTGSNTSPAAADDSATTAEDTPATIAVLSNDSDADGDALAVAAVGAPAHGTASANASGAIIYTPAVNYNGADSFTYVTTDSQGGTASATVSVTITAANDAPAASNDSYSTNEDTPLVVAGPGVLSNDSDPDGDALSAASITGPSHGTVTLNADGGFTYTPAANYIGPDSFSYKASDGTADSAIAIASISVAPVNDAPSGVADSYSIAEDGSLAVAAPGVLGNDTDAEGDSVSAVPLSGPSHGSLTLNADGSFVYTPAANFSGTDTFTYSANDGAADSAPVIVTVIVTPVNDSPQASGDEAATDEDTAVAIPVLANDSDVDNEALTISAVGVPAHGSASANADGTITYQPAADYFGPDGFTYTIADGQGGTDTASVAITVRSANDAPLAVNDAASTVEDTPVTIDVLDDDLDVDGDPLVVVAVGSPAHGSAALNPNGSITYTPAANYHGADAFGYTIADGAGGMATATVSLSITGANDAPSAVDDSYATSEDAALDVAAPGVLGNDSDADGDALSAAVVSGPSHGTLTLNTDGSFSYMPASNFSGSDSFTYQVGDESLVSEPATVTIVVNPVNDTPLATNDSYATNEDVTLTIAAPGVLGNDTDTEAGALTAILVSGPASGTLTLNDDGSFTYQPAANFNGTASFTYRVSDGSEESADATVTILVSPVNDAPLAVEDNYAMNEDGTLAIAAPGLLANDLDNDSSSLSVLAVGAPSHGTLTLNADGSFSYVPNADYNGADSFTYKISDGTTESEPATVNITINAVNDPPVAVARSYTSSEDTAMVLLAPGVLANDTDAENDPLTASVLSEPTHGTLTFGSDGGFTYVPNANFSGVDSFTYKASDGQADSNAATVTITIGGVNDPPSAIDDSFSVDEDTTLAVGAPGVTGNDTDFDGNALTVVRVSGPSHGTLVLGADGGFSYTPAANYNGPDSFTYFVNDGTVDSNVATVSLVVAALNDAPVATGNSYSTGEGTTLTVNAPGVLGNDTDGEGDPLVATVVTAPDHGALVLNANGSFTYTPAAGYSGPDRFTYLANDGAADSNIAAVTITVSGVNDAPVAADDSYGTGEDTALAIGAPGVLANDTDIDSTVLTVVLVTGPAHGTVTLGADGGFLYTPAANYGGTDNFTYKASDGTLDSNVATVTIAVNGVNDAPVAANNSYTKNEDVTLVVNAPGVLGNDSDSDGNALTAILVSGPSHGTLTLNANGSFTFVPAANYNGPDSFTYKANDGTVDSNVATVTLTITPLNDAPVAVGEAYTTNEDTPLTIGAPGLLANDTDIDSSALTAVRVTNAVHGTVVVNADGSFTYTPAANYRGADLFTYRVRDGAAGSNIAIVQLTVNGTNDAPIANSQAKSLNEDRTRAITLTGSDVDGDAITFVVVTLPAHGTLTGTAPNLSYAPAANYHGPDSFTFKVNDGSMDSNVGTVALTVTSVNDVPVAQTGSYTTPVNTRRSGQLAASDVDGDTLTYVVSTQPLKGTVVVNPATGAFVYTPFAGRTGLDSFRFKANDGVANSNAAKIEIRIQ